jgi:curved DNA-binding protein CbpA
MRDPYEVLGLKQGATPDEIRKAYRKLAKSSHPDLHPGDKAAEERFKELSLANEILSDPEKRARFDRGEIDASGAERPQHQYYRGYAESPEGERYARAEVLRTRPISAGSSPTSSAPRAAARCGCGGRTSPTRSRSPSSTPPGAPGERSPPPTGAP